MEMKKTYKGLCVSEQKAEKQVEMGRYKNRNLLMFFMQRKTKRTIKEGIQ